MDATHLIGLHMGLKIRAIQKMKAERPDEYELTLMAALAKSLGFDLRMFEEFYENGMMGTDIKNALGIAKGFKDIVRLAGFEEKKMQIVGQSNSLEEILAIELNSHKVNDSYFSVTTEIINEDIDNIKINEYIEIDVFVRERVSGELIYKTSLPFLPFSDKKISTIAKEIFSDIRKNSNLVLERVEQNMVKVEVSREWANSVNGGLMYEKYVTQINGLNFGQKEIYEEQANKFILILADKEFKIERSVDFMMQVKDWYCEHVINTISPRNINGLLHRLDKYILFFQENQKDIDNGAEFIKNSDGVEIDVSGEMFTILDLITEQLTGYRQLSTAISKSAGVKRIIGYGYDKNKGRLARVLTDYASSLLDEYSVGKDTVVVSFSDL